MATALASFPFRNLGLKFLSLCIATLLWLAVAGDRVAERTLRVPLEFQNLPSTLEIVGDTPETIEVRVRGSSGTLGRLAPGETSAVIDLRSVRAGQRLFHLTPGHVTVPHGVEVVQVSPSTIPVTFESSGVRIVPIRPPIDGEPAPGYQIIRVLADPPTVEVVGPESALRGVTEAITEPVSVAGATGTVQETVTVGVADPGLRLRMPRTAVVTVTIAPLPLESAPGPPERALPKGPA